MDFLNSFIQTTQADVVEEVQRLVEEKGIKDKVLQEAQALAHRQAMHIMNPTQCEEPESYKGIELNDEDRDEFLLVLEYLESIGLKFTPTVLRFESQNPQVLTDRENLCKRLNLRSYDRTPLLVQLIEERLNSFQADE
jgi:hypothetical protein